MGWFWIYLFANVNFNEQKIEEKLVQISLQRCFKEIWAFQNATKNLFYSEKEANFSFFFFFTFFFS